MYNITYKTVTKETACALYFLPMMMSTMASISACVLPSLMAFTTSDTLTSSRWDR